MDSSQRKGINFDLNTEQLQKYYPVSASWRNAYTDVKAFFESNGFEHIQGSGYHSKEAMSEAQAMAVIYKMIKALPWLNYCVKVCTNLMFRNCLIFRMYLSEKQENWKQRKNAKTLTNSIEYNLEQNASSFTNWHFL